MLIINQLLSKLLIGFGVFLILIGFGYALASLYCIYFGRVESICGIENSFIVWGGALMGASILAPGLVLQKPGKISYFGYLLLFMLAISWYSVHLYG